jgi:DNA-directed RNA polymerase subunit RPC12/RpoP
MAGNYVCGTCGWSKPVSAGRPPIKCQQCNAENVSRVVEGEKVRIERKSTPAPLIPDEVDEVCDDAECDGTTTQNAGHFVMELDDDDEDDDFDPDAETDEDDCDDGDDDDYDESAFE